MVILGGEKQLILNLSKNSVDVLLFKGYESTCKCYPYVVLILIIIIQEPSRYALLHFQLPSNIHSQNAIYGTMQYRSWMHSQTWRERQSERTLQRCGFSGSWKQTSEKSSAVFCVEEEVW